MGIDSFTIKPDQEYNENRSGSSAIWNYDIEFDVDTNEFDAAHASVVPRFDAPYPPNPFLVVSDISAKPVSESRRHWIVQVKFSSGAGSSVSGGVDPLSEPPDITWSTVSDTVEIDVDANGIPITNSADEVFDPPIQSEVADLEIRISRNEPLNPMTAFAGFAKKVNTQTWANLPPGTVLMDEISGKKIEHGDLVFYRVDYRLLFRFDGWKIRKLDKGYRTKAANGDLEIMTDKDGNPLSEPVFLDGSGQKLADGASGVFLEFEVRQSVNFDVLGLPENA